MAADHVESALLTLGRLENGAAAFDGDVSAKAAATKRGALIKYGRLNVFPTRSGWLLTAV